MARKRIGEILVEAGLLDEDGLRAALLEQRRRGGPLGRALVDLKLVPEDTLVLALSRQLAVPTVDLDAIEIPQHVVELVPGELAETHGLMPFAQPMKFLDVAMSDPNNLHVIDELRVRTHLNVRTHLAGPKAIERALAHYYGRGLLRGRRRDTLNLPPTHDSGEMELVSSFDPSASRTIPTTSVPATPQPRMAAASVAPPMTGRGPSFAELAVLQERIAALEALVRRDEDVLKKLMGLLIEKGVAPRDELLERLS